MLVHYAWPVRQRTGGVIIATYEMLVENKTAAEAFAQMREYGHDPTANPHLLEYLNSHMAELAQKLVDRHVIFSAECQSRCRYWLRNERKKANIEHRTPNIEHRSEDEESSVSTSMLDVGRSMFDVRLCFQLLIVLLAGLFIYGFRLGDSPLDRTEPFRARWSAHLEMVKGGDWLIPRLYGEVYLRKPPLIYWIEAGTEKLMGRGDELRGGCHRRWGRRCWRCLLRGGREDGLARVPGYRVGLHVWRWLRCGIRIGGRILMRSIRHLPSSPVCACWNWFVDWDGCERRGRWRWGCRWGRRCS